MYKVFLVDDEDITLTQIAETVPWLDNGFTVTGMESDPVRALEKILAEPPEVVFCDLRMPRMNGHELMRRILENGLHPEFVMLSAYGSFEDAKVFFKQEGFDYLLKPMDMNEMEILLENLTRRLAKKYPRTEQPDTADMIGTSVSFEALTQYVRANYKDHCTLDKLSRQFGLSGSYICALFSKYLNTSLISYVTRLRMEEAAARIKYGTEPYKSIAVSCGYKDYYYFSKVFKGYYGVSPSEYRENGRTAEPLE